MQPPCGDCPGRGRWYKRGRSIQPSVLCSTTSPAIVLLFCPRPCQYSRLGTIFSGKRITSKVFFFPKGLRKWWCCSKIQINEGYFKNNAVRLGRTQQPFSCLCSSQAGRSTDFQQRGTFSALNPAVPAKDCFAIHS